MRKRFLKDGRGSAAVETAMVLPLFLLMVFGFFEFGRIYWIQSTMNNAVTAAGRYAMLNVSATTSQIQTQAQANVVGMPAATIAFSVSTSASGGVNYATINASYAYQAASGLIPSIRTITLTRQITVPRV